MGEAKPYAVQMTERVSEWFLSNSKHPLVILFEQFVNDHIADMVILEKGDHGKRIVVVEIKSPRDDFRRMTSQCEDYLNWADEVYIGVEECDRGKAVKFVSEFSQREKIGILIITDEIEKIDPKRGNSPSFDNVEWSIRKDALVSTGMRYDIEITCKMRKVEVVKAINSHPKRNEIVRKSLIKTFIYRPTRKEYNYQFCSIKNISIWLE